MCLINYFYKDENKYFKLKPEFYVKQRKNRFVIKNTLKLKMFKVGDIFALSKAAMAMLMVVSSFIIS